jgi:S-adenosylmethionine-diacylglycerol 3-amino-3-carboxypropyl transferase
MSPPPVVEASEIPAPLAAVADFAGPSSRPRLASRVYGRVFEALYSRALVYNTCWEDPAVDRKALRIGAEDTVMVITSAGCNALDYALDAPRRIHAVDANPRQNALLELKLAGIRQFDFEDFFRFFGNGYHPEAADLYRSRLRADLSPFARTYWDRHHDWFGRGPGRRSFYFRGLSGRVARAIRAYLDLSPSLREACDAFFAARSIDEQRAAYDAAAPRLWSRAINWALSRQVTMDLLGVPRTQRAEVERHHASGVPGHVRSSVDYVFRELPIADNYFWRLYVYGGYTPECCPAYLKPDNFQRLKAGLAESIRVHTETVTRFLEGTREPISRFVLLDHMDWMGTHQPEALDDEWAAIAARAAPGARVIFRSAHAHPEYLRTLHIRCNGRRRPVHEALNFHPELARELTRADRVHTYAGFHIADFRT